MQSGQFGGKPFIKSLQNGVYHCNCAPEINTKADGNDHKRIGSPYSDTVNVREINDHTIEVVSKKEGKVVRKSKDTASEEGSTLNTEWIEVLPNGQQMNRADTWKRVPPAPAGSNKTSGSWQPVRMESASENMMTTDFKATTDGLGMADPLGDSYTAKFDGKDYSDEGDPGITSVSLKKVDDNTVEETDKRDGKIISVMRMTVSSDGKTMTVDIEDKLRDTTENWTAHKQ